MLDFIASLFTTGIWPYVLAFFGAAGALATFVARIRRSARNDERLAQADRNEKVRHSNDHLIEEARRARAAREAHERERLRSLSDPGIATGSLPVGPNPHSGPSV